MKKAKYKVAAISNAYKSLCSAKVTRMKEGEKFAVVRIMKALKPIATEYQGFIDDVSKKFMPENFEHIASKMPNLNSLTKEEREIFNRYEASVNKCVVEEGQREVSVEFTPISEESLQRLVEGSDLFLGEIMNFYDIIVQ